MAHAQGETGLNPAKIDASTMTESAHASHSPEQQKEEVHGWLEDVYELGMELHKGSLNSPVSTKEKGRRQSPLKMWAQNSSPVEKLRKFVPVHLPDLVNAEKIFCQLSRESLADKNSAPQNRLNFKVNSNFSDDSDSVENVKLDQNIDLDYGLADNYALENGRVFETPVLQDTDGQSGQSRSIEIIGESSDYAASTAMINKRGCQRCSHTIDTRKLSNDHQKS